MNPGDVVTVSTHRPASGFTVKLDDLTTGQTGFIQASADERLHRHQHVRLLRQPVHLARRVQHGQEAEPGAVGRARGWRADGAGDRPRRSLLRLLASKERSPSATARQVPTPTRTSSRPAAAAWKAGARRVRARATRPRAPARTPRPRARTARSRARRPRADCEFSDGLLPAQGDQVGHRSAARPAKEFEPVSTCEQNQFENGDLDFDGTGYRKDWPNGSEQVPADVPVPRAVHERAVPTCRSSSRRTSRRRRTCVTSAPAPAVRPRRSGRPGFYPFWSLTSKQKLTGVAGRGTCLWNFGNVIRHDHRPQLRQGRAVRQPGHRAVRRDHHQQGPAQPDACEGLQAGGLIAHPRHRAGATSTVCN